MDQLTQSEHDDSRKQLVGCGRTGSQQQLAIIHPETLLSCRSGQVGEIWVKGPSVAQGYWNRADATADTFYSHDSGHGGGALSQNGRSRCDSSRRTIRRREIKRPDHHPRPEPLSARYRGDGTGQSCFTQVRLRRGVLHPGRDEERLVVVQEVAGHSSVALDSVAAGVSRAVTEHHEVQVYAVLT